MGSEIKKLILGYIPSNVCNFKCKYCYISQIEDWGESNQGFKYSIDHMVAGLSRKRLGGVCQINITAQGETLLVKDIVPLVVGLLTQGHFVELVTNGSVEKVIKQLVSLPKELSSHIMFKISFHYQELNRLKLLEKFFENVNMVKDSPCSFTLELMPNDSLENEIDKIIRICEKKIGALCHVTIGRQDGSIGRELLTKHSREDYSAIWNQFHSNLFSLKMELYDRKRKEFCYAGAWSFFLDFQTGDIKSCYGQPVIQNIWKNIDSPIQYCPVGCNCTQPYCINGHAHLTFGLIPELSLPSYAEVRNRIGNDGTFWLKPEVLNFYSGKLSDFNNELSYKEKKFYSNLYAIKKYILWMKNPKKIYNQIKRQLRKLKNT